MSDFKVVLPTTTEEWQRDMDIAYEKGRKDAIDEIIKLVDDELTIDIGMDLFVDRDLLCERLEQLKENKNVKD